MTPELQTYLAFGSLIFAGLCLVYAMANPYRVRRLGRETVNSFLPQTRQEQILNLGDAWAGRSRVTDFQLQIMSFLGVLIAVGAAIAMIPLVGQLYGILIGLIFGALLYILPKQRYIAGFPKAMIQSLEREAPIFSAFMHRAIGITGMSVQRAFEQFIDIYPEKETTKLIRQVPEGVAFADAILELGLPGSELPNWLQTIQTIGSISEFGNPESILREVRDRIRKREEQYLRMTIKRKAFAAPATTVIIMLPGLMCVLLGAVGLQAYRQLGGGF